MSTEDRNPKCPDCRNGGQVLEDPKAGSVVCTSCGLVLEKQYLCETSEWRTFADDDKSGPDPNRVGGIGHYLLDDAGDLSTTTADRMGNLAFLQKTTVGNSHAGKLGDALRNIRRFCNRLSLPKDVENAAGELYKQLMDQKELRKRAQKSVWATCVYIAAKTCRADRPLKELCEEFQVDKTAVRRVHSEVKKLQAQERIRIPQRRGGRGAAQRRESTSEIFAVRYAHKLGLLGTTVATLRHIVREVEKVGCLAGKQPATVASACLYLTCRVASQKHAQIGYEEIAEHATVAVSTIQTAFRKHLHPNRVAVVPETLRRNPRLVNLPLK